MARIEMILSSLGAEFEKCDCCGKKIPRGGRINCVAYSDGEPAARLCDGCIEQWKQTGTPPPVITK